MTSYSKRESILESSPRVWRIEADALVRVLPGGEQRLHWSSVRQVRLRYAPTRLKTWRYIFTIDGAEGASMSFDNGHYVSMGEFEDRSAAFSAFVRAVLDKVAEQTPGARLYLGAAPLSFAALLAAMTIPMTFLCWIVLTIPIHDVRPELSAFGRLLVIGAMLPLASLWVIRSRPRPATFESLRENLP